LDGFSEKNNTLLQILHCENYLNEISNLKLSKKLLQEENKMLKNTINMYNSKNDISKFDIKQISQGTSFKNFFSCFNGIEEVEMNTSLNKK